MSVIDESGCTEYGVVERGQVDSLVMPVFRREDRYLVLKRRDIKNSLTELEQHLLHCIAAKIHKYRTDIMDKDPLHCVVVEKDWPEYEPTWKAIEDRMRA